MPVLKGTRLQGSTFGYKSDPLFNYTTLLLPGVGTNGANNNVFVDASTNNFAITRNGNTTQGTFSPFSQTGWSNYFDGTGDYFTVPYSANFNLSSGDWTMEAWFNANSFASGMIIIAKDTYGVNYDWSMLIGSSTSIALYTQRTAANLTVTVPAMSVGVWYHVAFVRSGSTNTIYLNGVSYGSNTMTISNESLTTPTIGCGSYNNPGSFMNGYISNLRVVKGTAVYTSNFTPPTAPLTAISGTSLLTCQSNRFLDASTNNLTITKNGDTRVVAFSPFAPTAEYTPSIHSGSGYFDGSGDYLNAVSADTANAMGTGDWTVEAWIYRTSGSGNAAFIFDTLALTGSSTDAIRILITPVDALGFYKYSTLVTSGGTISLNTWTHIAAVRSSGSIYLYINGSQVNTTYTDTGSNYTCGSNRPAIGVDAYNPSGYFFTGYICNLRAVKGVAVYTGNFTPPAGPITTAGSTSATSYLNTANVNTSFASSNTSLLLNFTNAGVYDATGKNNLETVGDAKISTAQSKFGLASMAFDGTGDYLVEPNNINYDFGSGDFTIEFWMYSSQSGFPAICAKRTAGGATNTNWLIQGSGGGILFYASNGSTYQINSIGGGTVNNSVWHHVAVTRSGSSFKVFVDGTQVGSTGTWSGTIASTSRPFYVGVDDINNLNYYNGYLQDLRITKGIARYTANFTPQASYLPLR